MVTVRSLAIVRLLLLKMFSFNIPLWRSVPMLSGYVLYTRIVSGRGCQEFGLHNLLLLHAHSGEELALPLCLLIKSLLSFHRTEAYLLRCRSCAHQTTTSVRHPVVGSWVRMGISSHGSPFSGYLSLFQYCIFTIVNLLCRCNKLIITLMQFRISFITRVKQVKSSLVFLLEIASCLFKLLSVLLLQVRRQS